MALPPTARRAGRTRRSPPKIGVSRQTVTLWLSTDDISVAKVSNANKSAARKARTSSTAKTGF